jgi:ATP-dependent RNA helicase RhlE
MKFSEYQLSDEIKLNLNRMGFTRPTDIQFKCISHIQNREDVLAIAQTGTGKTAAFAIPMIDKIQRINAKTKSRGIRALIMVPTRELSTQICEVFEQIGKGTGVKTLNIYGGVEQQPQIAKLLKGVDVLVSTPGRMFDLIHQGYVKLELVETLVLDEADHMLDLGFNKDIQDVLRFLPKRRQTLFFSATIDKEIKKLAYALVRNAIRIQISPKDPVSKNITHQVLFVKMDDKRFFLQRLIKENENLKFLVFVRTKVRAERVKAAMERLEVSSETIHGDKDQKERERTLAKFKTGKNLVLIATDVSARGIDIPHVDYVVNYDLPDKPENYVHRIGRTGRGRNKGLALSFCSPEEKSYLKLIEELVSSPISQAKVTKAQYAETLSFSESVEIEDENEDDWRSLMVEEEKPWTGKKRKKRDRS